MKTFASLFVLLVAPVVCGLGFVWDVETTRPQPYDAQAFHGETFELVATFKERGAQLSDGAATAQLYYQSPEMASTEWYRASATFDATTATVRATWSPALDTGAKSYRFFLAVETSVGANYRAYGTLRLKDSPGFNPTLLEPIDVREEIIADILEDVKVWAAPAEHTHAISDVTNLQSTLNNKANASHTHTMSNVSGLEDKLDYMVLRSRSSSDLKTNFITDAEAPIQFYGRTGDTMLPIFAMGSQLKAVDPNNIKLFNWVSFWFYDRIEFLEGNGTARIPYRFTANHGDRSEVIARIKDLPVIDTALSATSTNPVQNKAIMSQMMIFSSAVDSVQSSLNSKADASHTHAISDVANLKSSLDGKFDAPTTRICIGNTGSSTGTYAIAIGADSTTNDRYSSVAIGWGAKASGDMATSLGGKSSATGEAAVSIGRGSTAAANGGVAIGYNASASSNTPIVIGGSTLQSSSQIKVSSSGVLTVGGKEIGGNTEVWNDTIDSIDEVYDDMIGAKPLSSGNYPRLHARNKEIHGCTGFSNETGNYTGQELLLPWDVAMTNESSYLMAAVKFQANRGFGTQTFVQPLVPKETGSAQAFGFTHALPAFEDSPVYWKGHFIYSNARQMFLPWDKIATSGTGTLALVSDLASYQPALTAGENITIEGNVISATGGGSVTPTMETATWNETICSIAWSSHPLTVDFNGQNAKTANVQFPTDAWPEGAARMIFFKTSGITNTYDDALSEVCFDDAEGCLSVEFIGYEYLEAEAVHHATAYRFGDVLYISIVARRYIETTSTEE